MLKRREGFTLIELLIVVVIIGILAAIAIPKFGKAREKAYVAAMQSDLKQVMTAQEMYYGNPESEYSYATCTLKWDDPNSCQQLQVSASSGVTITITAEKNNGAASWYAVAEHSAAEQECAVFVGTDDAPDAVSAIATTPGVIACKEKSGSD